MKKLTEIISLFLIAAVLSGFVFGVYWVGKTFSYTIFYRGMVEETVREMVKPEFLKENER